MAGLDTNVLVRIVTNDMPAQARRARSAILAQNEPCHVSRETLLELVWVLESAYNYGRSQIAGAVDAMLHTSELQIEDADTIQNANRLYNAGADFTDALIATTNRHRGCSTTLTFDKTAASRARLHMTLIP